MKQSIDFYMVTISPWCHLSLKRLKLLKENYNIEINIKPVDIFSIFKKYGTKGVKDRPIPVQKNRLNEIRRWSQYLKIENGTNKLLWGKPIITQKINNLDFEISMESFFQTNPRCAEKLYNKAIDYVIEESIDETKFVLDLFCGTGTIGQLLSKRNQDLNVIGVDIVSEAINDANRNAIKNKLNNLEFFASDVGKFLKFKPELVGNINTIILDPPRAGIAPKTLVKVMELGAKNIVYISCNPSTQARDASSLAVYGYVIEKITLVDQFPHTGHIESIIKFKSSKEK